jgi:hypothetical protein
MKAKAHQSVRAQIKALVRKDKARDYGDGGQAALVAQIDRLLDRVVLAKGEDEKALMRSLGVA